MPWHDAIGLGDHERQPEQRNRTSDHEYRAQSVYAE
jgi:hypothetical protein